MKNKTNIVSKSIVFISFLLFFLGFEFNAWKVVNDQKFDDFARPAESLILGRLVKSGQDGIFSAGGLCGNCLPDSAETKTFEFQYIAYEHGMECPKYSPYKSQIGGHAMFYGILDQISPFSKSLNLFLFRALNAALLAFFLSLLVKWIFHEFGLTAALIVILAILLTPWFTLLGRNTWYCLWTNFLPFVIMLLLLERESNYAKPSERKILFLSILAILINFLVNGFEWVTTTLIMASIPLFYYWIRDRWGIKKFIRRLAILSAGAIVSGLATFTIIALQISTISGKFSDGIQHIIFSFNKRAYGGVDLTMADRYIEHTSSDLHYVLYIYLGGTAFKLPPFLRNLIPEPYNVVFMVEVILIFFVVSLLIYFFRRKWDLTGLMPLIWTTWISILAPLSWFIIFKGHSYSHWHMNNITWFMPFCLFGFAMAGAWVEMLFRKQRRGEASGKSSV